MSQPRRSAPTTIPDLALLQREIGELIERLSVLERTDAPATGDWCPSTDVYESRGNVMVVMEVPGLAPEALKVVVKDRCLFVSAERRERRPPGGQTAFLCVERPQGRFTRKIPLDMAVDLAKAEACLSAGLLMISVPRVKDRRGREIAIVVRRAEE
jgi:HSP20 family protein